MNVLNKIVVLLFLKLFFTTSKLHNAHTFWQNPIRKALVTKVAKFVQNFLFVFHYCMGFWFFSLWRM